MPGNTERCSTGQRPCAYLMETDGETFAMSGTEREGPPASQPKRPGFSIIGMEALAERRVDGEVKLDYAR
jgi:hypothetical protein